MIASHGSGINDDWFAGMTKNFHFSINARNRAVPFKIFFFQGAFFLGKDGKNKICDPNMQFVFYVRTKFLKTVKHRKRLSGLYSSSFNNFYKHLQIFCFSNYLFPLPIFKNLLIVFPLL